MKRRKLTSQANRETLSAFLPPGVDDEIDDPDRPLWADQLPSIPKAPDSAQTKSVPTIDMSCGHREAADERRTRAIGGGLGKLGAPRISGPSDP